jgi:rRNA-processing protein FCF1
MVKVLVDTDVVIDYVKGRLELGEGVYYISEITL